jgi:hypothetical protein
MSDKTAIEWADVPGWPQVRASRCGQVQGPSGRILKPYVSDSGHLHVLIRLGGRAARARKLRVHHAVLLAFAGPRPDGALARHLNDVPDDNRVENLSWGTPLDNAADRRRNRGYATGADAGSPLASGDVALIRDDARPSRVVAADFGVSHTTVLKIRRGERWAA